MFEENVMRVRKWVYLPVPLDAGCKLNAHKSYILLLNVLFTFNLRLVSRRYFVVFFFSFISGVMDVTFVFDGRIQWRYITTLLLKNFQFSQFKCSFNGVLFCIYYNCKYKSCFARSSKSRKTSQIFFNSYEA